MNPWTPDARPSDDRMGFTQDDLRTFSPVGNKQIRDFLAPNNRQRTVLVAPKGYGKTILLRKKSSDYRREANAGVVIHPTNAAEDIEYLQVASASTVVFDWEWVKAFNTPQLWCQIWTYAIAFAVCRNESARPTASLAAKHVAEQVQAHFGGAFDLVTNSEHDAQVTGKAVRLERRKLRKGRMAFPITRVGNFVSIMLRDWVLRSTEFESLFDEMVRPMIEQLSVLHVLFLDSPDEALSWDQSKTINEPDIWGQFPDHWVHLQLGLVDAIRALSGYTSNVRVFTSIRAEALNTLKGATQAQFEPLCVRLEYNHDEMLQIFEQNITVMHENEEFSPSLAFADSADGKIHSFLGVTEALHQPTGKYENIFTGILRHTLWRPRDLMWMGKALMEKVTAETRRTNTRDALDEIRQTIDSVSRDLLKHHRFQAIPAWPQKMDEILRQFKTNVVHESSIRVRQTAENQSAGNVCPFDYLYSQGFIAPFAKTIAGGAMRLNFVKGPGIAAVEMSLPAADWYALHPVLYGDLRSHHDSEFIPCPLGIVGYDAAIGSPHFVSLDLACSPPKIKLLGSEYVELRVENVAEVFFCVVLHALHSTQRLVLTKADMLASYEKIHALHPTVVDIKSKVGIAFDNGGSDETKEINAWVKTALGLVGQIDARMENESPPSTNRRKQAPIRMRYDKPNLYFDGLKMTAVSVKF